MSTIKLIGGAVAYFAGYRKFCVRDYQRGLLWGNGKFQGLLEKDEKWILDPMGEYSMEVFSRLDPWFSHAQLPAMVKSGLLPEEEMTVLDLDSNQRALVWRDGCFYGILEPGRWAWWKGLVDIRYEIYDIRERHGRFAHDDLDSIMMNPAFAAHFLIVLVRPGSKAAYYHNGKFVSLLEPGKYVYWKAVDGNQFTVVDMREITLDIGGQDMLTADKLALRLNVSLTCRVVDVMKSLDESVDAKQALYREAQLLLRAKVGAVELDNLLSDKDSLAGELEQELRARAGQYGYLVTSFGVRDIILPGDIKVIMNKVVEAKKASEAATITRREETAALRHQLNGARLVAENPVLMRLREMETLEKVAASGKLKVILGDKGLSEKLATLI